MKKNDEQAIVVTGAAGFIGSGVVRHLNDLGYTNIVVVDELGGDERWKNLVGKKFNDIIEKQHFFQWLEGRHEAIRGFIHLGACSSTVETDASFLLENNYRFTVRLAEYALRHEKRFIYASSAATYGDGALGFDDDLNAIESLEPLNMYGYSKQLFDLWAKRQGVVHKMVGLKYFNVFGPNEYHKGRMSSAIVRMVPQVQNEGIVRLFQSSEPQLFGDGEQKRDFIYVKDAVRMTTDFLFNNAGGIYNIGSGVASTWNEMARAVFKAINKEARIEYIPMPADLIGKYQNYTKAEMQRAEVALQGKTECQPFSDSVIEYVKDYLLPGKRW